MNKIATYLNQHLLGEASSAKAVRKRLSRDGSVLTMTPEIVVFPRVTNDIRKVARFTWQLAEKGHALAVTTRGAGGDTTGAAIGKGILLDLSAHLRSIVAVMPKDKLAHAQAGASLEVLQETLKWQGLTLAHLPDDLCHTTVGGAIAGNAWGTAGPFADNVERLEVVLANGDIIETGRMSRHDVNKKLGLQTFEGEIYRKLSGLLEDNEELIKKMASDQTHDAVGYRSISRIKNRDGSIDLTPLFVGSQGTLGVISEAVLKTEFYSSHSTMALIVGETPELARDLGDRLKELEPSRLLTIDGALLNRAVQYSKTFSLVGEEPISGAATLIAFNDISDRAQAHKLKKLRKLVSKMGLAMLDSTDHDQAGFAQLFDAPNVLARVAGDDEVTPPLQTGAYIPQDRREEFAGQVEELAHKHHLDIPSVTNILTGVVSYYPPLKLHAVSDKQKLFRLMSDYATLVDRCGGAIVAEDAEGRLKSSSAWALLDDDEAKLYEQIREVFDPFGTLNPGVKQKTDLRGLVSHLRTSYDTTDFLA